MTSNTAVKIARTRWAGPEFSRHIAGKAVTERDAKRAALSWMDELAILYPPR